SGDFRGRLVVRTVHGDGADGILWLLLTCSKVARTPVSIAAVLVLLSAPTRARIVAGRLFPRHQESLSFVTFLFGEVCCSSPTHAFNIAANGSGSARR